MDPCYVVIEIKSHYSLDNNNVLLFILIYE